MNRCLFAGHLVCATLLLVLSPCLRAQSDSELTISGNVYYSGTHTGPVHIAAVDRNDAPHRPDVNDVPFAGHTTLPEPGPYSLTIPHVSPEHSYAVVAQMDIDSSGRFSFTSFQRYEPSGNYEGCARGNCKAPISVPGEDLPDLDVDIYLSDIEPLCVLLDTFEADFFSGGAGDMGYHAGHLWVCDSPWPNFGGPTDIHRIDPNTGDLVASYDLGIDHCTSLEWIGSEMWVCFKGYSFWTLRQYVYDGTAFTQGVSYALPSSMDWNTVWSVNIAWDGALLWAQEKGHCGNIYKLDLSDGSLLETISECDFTFNKWLGLADMSDICFSDGYLWAMNDGAATFAKMAPDPNQLPPETHYTFAFDPNRDVFDDLGVYYGMVKHGDLFYFVEGIDVEDAEGEVIGRKHRIHTARIEQADQSDRDLILQLGGQYWFGSLSVDLETSAPWAKRGTASIVGNQWHQQWDDGNGPQQPFSSAFTTTARPDGSINVNFLDFPAETYNVAWNGNLMIHAGSVLGGGGEGIDIFTRKATNVDVNDVLGDHSYFGHHLDSPWSGESCGWGDFAFGPNGTVTGTITDDRGVIESDTINWTLDDANAVIDIVGPRINDVGHATLYLGEGGIGCAWQIVPEEGRGDLGYAILIKKTKELIAMADIAGTYQVRFLETGPGGVPYTCGQGTCVLEAVDDARGILWVDAHYSDGEHDVSRKDCSVGPGNEFHVDDESVPDGIISRDKNLIFIPEYRYTNPPTRTPGDWLGGIFLIRTPATNNNTAEL